MFVLRALTLGGRVRAPDPSARVLCELSDSHPLAEFLCSYLRGNRRSIVIPSVCSSIAGIPQRTTDQSEEEP